jgi:hypothetical protein
MEEVGEMKRVGEARPKMVAKIGRAVYHDLDFSAPERAR